MTPEQASFLLSMTLPEARSEAETTRRVLEAVPDDQGAYTPDAKSMSAFALASHIAGAEMWFLSAVATGQFGKYTEMPAEVAKPSDVVAWYDAHLAPALAAIEALDGATLAESLDLFGMLQMSRIEFLRFSVKHTVHHRGQLSAYLRPMGAKVPGIYGPSGDSKTATA